MIRFYLLWDGGLINIGKQAASVGCNAANGMPGTASARLLLENGKNRMQSEQVDAVVVWRLVCLG